MVHRSSSIHSIESVNSSNEAPHFLGKQHPTSATKNVAGTAKQSDVSPSYAIPDTLVTNASPKKITRSRSDRFSIDTSSSTNSSSASTISSTSITEKRRLSHQNVTNRNNSDNVKNRNECVQDSSDSCSSAAVPGVRATIRSATSHPHSSISTTTIKNVTTKSTIVRTKKFTKSPTKTTAAATTTTTNTTTQFGLKCSLPLDRLSGIVVGALVKGTAGYDATTPTTATVDNETETDAAAILQKTMCLYCDRTFSSHKLYLKHSQRVHEASEGRRSSQRQSYTSLLLYPGCAHCNNGKTTSLPADELPALFHHLIDIHFDRYFACMPCQVRFPNGETLKEHIAERHQETAAPTPAVVYKKRKKPINSDRSLVAQPKGTSITLPVDPDKSDANDDNEESDDDVGVDDDEAAAPEQPVEPVLRSSRRQQQAKLASIKAAPTLRKKQMLRNEETILTRLGIAQNRSPRTRRGGGGVGSCGGNGGGNVSSGGGSGSGTIKSRPDLRAETPNLKLRKSTRSAGSNSTGTNQTMDSTGNGDIVPIIPISTMSSTRTSGASGKTESLSSTFDEHFYESVNVNVRQNLSCHLDGRLDGTGDAVVVTTKPLCVLGLSAIPAVRSTLVKSSPVNDNEIHEATALTALTAFPTLLTAQQYGAEPMPLGKIKKPITKNSWKWKWDCVKKYKYVNEGGKFVKKIKQPIAGLRDLSKLDMWTQLTMRTKHEVVRRQEFEVAGGGDADSIAVGEVARQEKQKLIEQLNSILDRRILPQINVEQNDQRIVKLERIDDVPVDSKVAIVTSAQPAADDLPSMLCLSRRDPAVTVSRTDLVLSGEWARPRCYVCYGCGARFETIKLLDEHKSARHPHVYSTHYEIVGKELIDGNLFRHFYIPSTALQRHSEYARRNLSAAAAPMLEDSMDSVASGSLNYSNSFDMDSASQNSKGSLDVSSTSTVPPSPVAADDSGGGGETKVTPMVAGSLGRRECTKCKRPCNGMIDLYRHMLDCSNDYAWVLAKKRQNIKYRYFGSRRRKAQRSSASKRRIRPKKEDQPDTPQRMREPQPPKPRPSDAESIQRMLANLPAKRACRQIFPNISPQKRKFVAANTIVRGGRKQIVIKHSAGGKTARSFKYVTSAATTVAAINKNIQLRKQQHKSETIVVRSTRSSPQKAADDVPAAISGNGESRTAPIATRNELIKVLRRKTQRVVSKITNTFRRPLQKKKTNQKHEVAAVASQPETAIDVSSELPEEPEKLPPAKKEVTTVSKTKNIFKRTLTFRKAKSTAKVAESTEPTMASEPVDVVEEKIAVVAVPKVDEKKKPVAGKTLNAVLKNLKKKNETECSPPSPPQLPVEQSATENTSQKTTKTKDSDENVTSDITMAAPPIANDVATTQIETDKQLPSIEVCRQPTDMPKPIGDLLSIAVIPTSTSMVSPGSNVSPGSTSSCAVTPTISSQTPIASATPLSQSTPTKGPQRRRTRKLNDCIAMLTGKLQERLGVPFIESSNCPILSPTNVDPSKIIVENVPAVSKVADVIANPLPAVLRPAVQLPAVPPKIVITCEPIVPLPLPSTSYGLQPSEYIEPYRGLLIETCDSPQHQPLDLSPAMKSRKPHESPVVANCIESSIVLLRKPLEVIVKPIEKITTNPITQNTLTPAKDVMMPQLLLQPATFANIPKKRTPRKAIAALIDSVATGANVIDAECQSVLVAEPKPNDTPVVAPVPVTRKLEIQTKIEEIIAQTIKRDPVKHIEPLQLSSEIVKMTENPLKTIRKHLHVNPVQLQPMPLPIASPSKGIKRHAKIIEEESAKALGEIANASIVIANMCTLEKPKNSVSLPSLNVATTIPGVSLSRICDVTSNTAVATTTIATTAVLTTSTTAIATIAAAERFVIKESFVKLSKRTTCDPLTMAPAKVIETPSPVTPANTSESGGRQLRKTKSQVLQQAASAVAAITNSKAVAVPVVELDLEDVISRSTICKTTKAAVSPTEMAPTNVSGVTETVGTSAVTTPPVVDAAIASKDLSSIASNDVLPAITSSAARSVAPVVTSAGTCLVATAGTPLVASAGSSVITSDSTLLATSDSTPLATSASTSSAMSLVTSSVMSLVTSAVTINATSTCVPVTDAPLATLAGTLSVTPTRKSKARKAKATENIMDINVVDKVAILQENLPLMSQDSKKTRAKKVSIIQTDPSTIDAVTDVGATVPNDISIVTAEPINAKSKDKPKPRKVKSLPSQPIACESKDNVAEITIKADDAEAVKAVLTTELPSDLQSSQKLKALINGIELMAKPKLVVVDFLKSMNNTTTIDLAALSPQLPVIATLRKVASAPSIGSIVPVDSVKKSKKSRVPSKKSAAKEPDEVRVFESSDEELLPWDPEVGFVGKAAAATNDTELPSASVDETNVETAKPEPSVEITTTTKPAVNKQRKRRKNELAKIIADQLLESFKAVDQSRIEELKILHDLSIQSSDELLLSTNLSETPRRNTQKATAAAAVLVDGPPSSSESLDIESDSGRRGKKTITETTSSQPKIQKVNRSKASVAKPVEQVADVPEETDQTTAKTTKIVSALAKTFASSSSPDKLVPSKLAVRKKVAFKDKESGNVSDTEVKTTNNKPAMISKRRQTLCSELPLALSDVCVPLRASDLVLRTRRQRTIGEKISEKPNKAQPIRAATPKPKVLTLAATEENEPASTEDISKPKAQTISGATSKSAESSKKVATKSVVSPTNDSTAVVAKKIKTRRSMDVPPGTRLKRNSNLKLAVSGTAAATTKKLGGSLSEAEVTADTATTTSIVAPKPINDLVAQIICDFTTSTIDSRNSSPMFGDLTKANVDRLPKQKDEMQPPNGFHAPSTSIRNHHLDLVRSMDVALSSVKSPVRAPFMSPRWESPDAAAASQTSDVLATPKLSGLWTTATNTTTTTAASPATIKVKSPAELNLFQCVKDKSKKLLTQILKRKSKKSDKKIAATSPPSAFMSPATVVATSAVLKRPLLRPSILAASSLMPGNPSDAAETEICLRKLESNSLFVGRERGLAAATTNIFVADKSEATASSSSKKFDALKFGEPAAKEVCVLETITAKEMRAVDVVPKSAEEKASTKTKKPSEATTLRRRKLGSLKRQHMQNQPVKKACSPPPSKTHTIDLNVAFLSASPLPLNAVHLPNYDASSQDTILSDIVNKIRNDANDHTESDEDLCLAEIAKSLNNKLFNSDEFSNCGNSPPDAKANADDDEVFEVPLPPLAVGAVPPSTPPPPLKSPPAPSTSSVPMREPNSTASSKDDDDIFDMDENTNTDLVDMDLEDTMSVYTSFSVDTTVTASGGGRNKKKRRFRKSILSKSARRARKQDDPFLQPPDNHYCSICSKKFCSPSGLASHRNTISHISKLSEQEFLRSQESTSTKAKSPAVVEPQEQPNEELQSPQNEQERLDNDGLGDVIAAEPTVVDEQPIVAAKQTPEPVPQQQQQHYSPALAIPLVYPAGIEPISSPEQQDYSDRYGIVGKKASIMPSENLRLALSQEERLFYECCSMLKGSERPTSASATALLPKSSPLGRISATAVAAMQPSKPVTPKSNDQYEYAAKHQQINNGGGGGGGGSKIDPSQFSDISSDSNPAYSCPQVPSSSVTGAPQFGGSAGGVYARDVYPEVHSFGALTTTTTTSGSMMREFANADHFSSDMGDSFPSLHDECTGRGTKHYHHHQQQHDGGIGGCCDGIGVALPKKQMESPIYSSSSQGSSAHKPRTKAAMKGYENFKVSIPTTGIDLQQALVRSPNPAGCKLAALADIALGNDVPHTVGLNPSVSCTVEPSKTGLDSSSVANVTETPPPLPEPTERSVTPFVQRTPTPVRKAVRTPQTDKPKSNNTVKTPPNGRKKARTPVGNKLGFNQRKKKLVPKAAAPMVPATVKDVYDFEDSHDSVEEPIVPLISQIRTVKTPSTELTASSIALDAPDDSQLSSFSDRDDYNYEDSLSDSDDASRASSTVTKRSATSCSINNVQKKSLIMGRIFKSVKKTDLPKDSVPGGGGGGGGGAATSAVKEVKKKIPKQELDKMFDSLRGADMAHDDAKASINVTPAKPEPMAVTTTTTTTTTKTNVTPKTIAPYAKDDATTKSRCGGRRSRKPREIANLEAEWGMSMDTIIDLMGVGQRKTQRRCATNKQKTFAETWSSDEYEEFHSTKDIIALIQEVEQKASKSVRSARRNDDGNSSAQTTVATVKSDETTKKQVKEVDKENVVVASATVRPTKVPKKEHSDAIVDIVAPVLSQETGATTTAASAKVKKMTSFFGLHNDDDDDNTDDDDDDDVDDDGGMASENSVRSKPDRMTTPKRAKIKKRRRTIAFKEREPATGGGRSVVGKQMPKKKNNNADVRMSSTGGGGGATLGSASGQRPKTQPKAMARRKRIASEMLYYWSSSDDEEFGRIKPRENYDDDNLEQHGWIVGDSHKKLVTLLAHAKGKKIEDCGVKEAIHKKKS